MPSAAENHEINRIGNMPIVNKQVKFLTSQYIGTCKSAYILSPNKTWTTACLSLKVEWKIKEFGK